MSHTRIRTFNTRDTYPEQKLDNDLCQAVVAGNTVYLRGQVGQNIDTAESVGVGDVAAQTEQAVRGNRELETDRDQARGQQQDTRELDGQRGHSQKA